MVSWNRSEIGKMCSHILSKVDCLIKHSFRIHSMAALAWLCKHYGELLFDKDCNGLTPLQLVKAYEDLVNAMTKSSSTYV